MCQSQIIVIYDILPKIAFAFQLMPLLVDFRAYHATNTHFHFIFCQVARRYKIGFKRKGHNSCAIIRVGIGRRIISREREYTAFSTIIPATTAFSDIFNALCKIVTNYAIISIIF